MLPSLNITSSPPASNTISPATSSVKSPDERSISVPSIVILSMDTPPSAVKVEAVKFLKSPASLLESTTTALLAATVPSVMPSNFSRSVSFIDAEPIMNDPVAVTSAFTTTFALKFVTSLTSIALESIALISDTNNPPTTSSPSLTLMLLESVDIMLLISSVAPFNVPLAVKFLKPEATSAEPSNTNALLAAPAPFVMPSIFSKSVSSMSADPIINLVAVTFLNPVMSLSESTTTALLAVTVPAVSPSSCSRSASFIEASPMIKDPVASTSAFTTTFALKFVTSFTSIALESMALISDTNNPPTTSSPSLIRMLLESVENIEFTSSKAVLTVPEAVTFLKSPMSLFESTTTALDATTVPAVLPSTKFNSAAVDVTAVPLIANLSVTTLNVPLSSIRATSVPSLCWKIRSLASTTGLIITSLDEFVILNISVPPALKLKSLPPASSIISAAASTVRLFAEMTKSVPSPSIFSEAPPNTIPTSFGICISEVAFKFIFAPDAIVRSVPSPDIFSPESANCNSLPDATSNAETSPSSLNTSVAEPPSLTVNIKSLFEVELATVTSPLDAVIPTPALTVSDPTSSAAKEESVTDVASAAELDNTALNESSPSFQYNTALLPADPRCTNIPASTSAPPELFLFSSKSAS